MGGGGGWRRRRALLSLSQVFLLNFLHSLLCCTENRARARIDSCSTHGTGISKEIPCFFTSWIWVCSSAPPLYPLISEASKEPVSGCVTLYTSVLNMHFIVAYKLCNCAGILEQSVGDRNRIGIGLSYQPPRARNFKWFRSPGIDSKEAIPPAYIAYVARYVKKGCHTCPARRGIDSWAP